MAINPILEQIAPVGFFVPMNQMVDFIVSTLIFAVIGLIVFAVAFWIIVKISPFSIRKEIEEDHNVALAILISSVILGIALVISAAVHG
jgi:putative membrane protein